MSSSAEPEPRRFWYGSPGNPSEAAEEAEDEQISLRDLKRRKFDSEGERVQGSTNWTFIVLASILIVSILNFIVLSVIVWGASGALNAVDLVRANHEFFRLAEHSHRVLERYELLGLSILQKLNSTALATLLAGP